jgi:4-hydroxy-4-methyl-2-oxoglutarate aldolase
MTPDTAKLLGFGSAIIHEAAGRRGALGPSIRPLWPGARVAGPVRTVRLAPGDNLGAHVAVERSRPGDVLCIASSGQTDWGFWGEVLSTFAMSRGVAGLVTSFGVRDARELEKLGFPAFSGAHTVLGTIKADLGVHDVPVRIGEALVRPGDWIVADVDGCATVRGAELGDVLARAAATVEKETLAMEGLRAGLTTTREFFGLPAGQPAAA